MSRYSRLIQIFQDRFDDVRKYIIAPKKNEPEQCDLTFEKQVFLFGDTFIKFTHQSSSSLTKTPSQARRCSGWPLTATQYPTTIP